MKIYDISQEVFTCTVFPGDPAPKREIMESMSEGATVDGLKPEHFVGPAYVAEHQGIVTGTDGWAGKCAYGSAFDTAWGECGITGRNPAGRGFGRYILFKCHATESWQSRRSAL